MATRSITISDWRKIGAVVSADRKRCVFPPVESTKRTGAKMSWIIYVELFDAITGKPITIDDEYFDNGEMPETIHAKILVDSQQVGGKTRDVVPTIVEHGTNIGKKNETNVFCQALRDALGKRNKQLQHAKPEETKAKADDKAATATSAKVCYPPMLATKMDKIDWSATNFIQRKYDGIRCIATLRGNVADKMSDVMLYSRNCKEFPEFDRIRGALLPLFRNVATMDGLIASDMSKVYFDGELYEHGKHLQEISGEARASEKCGMDIKYYIYDMFVANNDAPFEKRYDMLHKIFEADANLHLVETEVVASEADARKFYDVYLKEGFEGAILRTNTPYVYSYNNHHSNHLQKMKPTMDEEYEVIRYTSGKKGKAAKSVMFVFKTKEGKEFAVTPAMPIAEREALLEKMEQVGANGRTFFENEYLGVPIRVEFDDLSKDGIPLRARTKLERRPVKL